MYCRVTWHSGSSAIVDAGIDLLEFAAAEPVAG
jgi:hypothetical protein